MHAGSQGSDADEEQAKGTESIQRQYNLHSHTLKSKQKLQYTDCLKATWNRGIFSWDPKQASEGAFLRPAGSEFKTLGGQECKWTLTRSFETGFQDFGKLFMSNCQTDQPPTTRFIVVECFCQFCWSCCITERLVLRRKCFCNEFCWDLDTLSYDCNVWTDFGFACVCVCVFVYMCVHLYVCLCAVRHSYCDGGGSGHQRHVTSVHPVNLHLWDWRKPERRNSCWWKSSYLRQYLLLIFIVCLFLLFVFYFLSSTVNEKERNCYFGCWVDR